MGSGKISPQHVVTRFIQNLSRETDRQAGALTALPATLPKDAKAPSASQLGIRVEG